MFKFLYNFLFIDQNTKQLSHTKFWSNIGYGIMCWAFIFVLINDTTNIDYMFWVLFACAVIGNRTAKEIMKKDK